MKDVGQFTLAHPLVPAEQRKRKCLTMLNALLAEQSSHGKTVQMQSIAESVEYASRERVDVLELRPGPLGKLTCVGRKSQVLISSSRG